MKNATQLLVIAVIVVLAGGGILVGANTMGSTRFTGANPTGVLLGIVVTALGVLLLITALLVKARAADRRSELQEEAFRRALSKEPSTDDKDG